MEKSRSLKYWLTSIVFGALGGFILVLSLVFCGGLFILSGRVSPPLAINRPNPTSTPFPPCIHTSPQPEEGAQAWMLNVMPAPGAETKLCARLIIDGSPARDATVTTNIIYRDKQGFEKEMHTGTTQVGERGIATIGLAIGDAMPGSPVEITVNMESSSHGPRVYSTYTEFTPLTAYP